MEYSPYPNGRPQWLLQDQSLGQETGIPQQRNDPQAEVMLSNSEDVSVTTPLSTSVHPHAFYAIQPFQFSPYNSFQLSPYGQQQSQQQWSVPLSSYSSLNGATSGQSSSSQPQRSPVQTIQSPLSQHSPPPQQPQQYQQSQTPTTPQPQPQQIAIDPSLMLTSYNHQTNHSPTSYAPANFFSYSSLAPQLSLNPSLLHNSSQSQPQPQSPISQPQPQLLSQPQSNGPVAGPSNPSKSTLTNVLNGLLSSKGLSNSPTQIVRTITAMGPSEVELPMRLQVLSKIRDYASNDFYQAWASNIEAMDIIRDWLKGAVTSKTGEWDETVMPLLHVIDRLPLTLDSLKNAKIGKVILKLKETSLSAAVKDMASNLENRWRSLLQGKSPPENGGKKSEGKSVEEPRPKKRKLDEQASKAIPPAKKVVLTRPAVPSKVVALKKEPKPVTAVKDAKSDSSFFSAPKPKPKLPSFKKAPPLKKEPALDTNVAQPSAVDPFKDALAAMTKARSSTPVEVNSTPPSTVTIPPGKTKKKVSFASEEKLVQIKLIEPAVYDDDTTSGLYQTHNVRDLDRDEGAAMHKHLFEEQIDWVEPTPLDIPAPLDTPRGESSQEKMIQEEREKSALNALYMSASQIPDTPAEPTSQIPEDEVDTNIKHMLSGSEVRELDRGDRDTVVSVQGLISQLAGAGMAAVDPMNHNDTPTIQPMPAVDLKQLGFDLNLIAQLAAQQQQSAPVSAPVANGYGYTQPPQQPYAGDSTWNNSTQYQDYGGQGGYEDDSSRGKSWDGHSDQGWRGRGGRGGGGVGGGRGGGRGGAFRNTKRKLCNFFANGRRASEIPSPPNVRETDS